MSPETRLRELGLVLPSPRPPAFRYVPCREHQGVLYVSGQLPWDDQGRLIAGKVTSQVSLEDACAAARCCVLQALAHIKAHLGTLDRVEQVLKLTGFVHSDPDFVEQPRVIDAASEVLLQVFGPRGAHARTAVGVASLPRGAAVEVELIVAFT